MNTIKISTRDVLVAFLKDYYICNRTDLYGHKTGGYEFFSSGSVGGYMNSCIYKCLEDTVGRHIMEQAALALHEYTSNMYSDICTYQKTSKEILDEKDAKIMEIATKYSGEENEKVHN